MTTKLPHRLSYASAVRFATLLRQMSQLPTNGSAFIEVPFPTLGLAPVTFIARLRDAYLSLCAGHTTLPLLDLAALQRVWPLYTLVEEDDRVRVVPRAEKKTETAGIVSSVSNQETPVAVCNATDEPTLHALALLLGNRTLEGTVQLVGAPSTELVEKLRSSYDIMITKTDTGWRMF